MLISALVALLLLGAAGSGAAEPARAPLLAVPFLPQTEALCGGASAAMVFRYWGDRRADVQQFEPLVDRRAGGIADDVLVDAVRARGWEAIRLKGSLDLLREQLQTGQPLILLLEDRPGFYHYVVAVGASADAVYLHDPVWGPNRRMADADLLRLWRPSNFWTVAVRPGASGVPVSGGASAKQATDVAASSSRMAPAAVSPCDDRLGQAVAAIRDRGIEEADGILAEVRVACPESAGPLRELAGVRFAQRRYEEAGALAAQAAARDPADEYAWDVLGSSRFLRDDLAGALEAWNAIDRPQLDSVRIDGLERTRYALVARALALEPNTLLTADDFRLAGRRLRELPTRSASRLGYRPDADGFATVDVAIVERSTTPAGAAGWAAWAAGTLIDRQIDVAVPGRMGQGEVWSAAWRWWEKRPRVALSFSAPRVGWLAGTWRVTGAWEEQHYRGAPGSPALRERRLHGAVAAAGWMTADLRYELLAGLDSWNDEWKSLALGATLEQRVLADRLALGGTLTRWLPIDGAGFHEAGAFLAAATSTEPRGVVVKVRAGVEGASRNAPLALWGGAGEGQARRGLLRAHPLLADGVIAGPAFGRRLSTLNVETEWWLERPSAARLAVAVFADAARAWHRLPGAVGAPFQVDAGAGLRLRLPGVDHTLRIDYGRGLRDGRDAITLGVVAGGW